jgi:hypothetical protein
MFLLGDVADASFFDGRFCGCLGCFFFEIKTFLLIGCWILGFCVVGMIVGDDGSYAFFFRALNIEKFLFGLWLWCILVEYSLKLLLVVRIFFCQNFQLVFFGRLAALRLRLNIYFQTMYIAWAIWAFGKSIYNLIKLNCMSW